MIILMNNKILRNKFNKPDMNHLSILLINLKDNHLIPNFLNNFKNKKLGEALKNILERMIRIKVIFILNS
jgi:hypothetical protein